MDLGLRLPTLRSVPKKDFNYQTYLLFNPDLRASGIRTAESAWSHYQTKGKQRGRQPERVPVLVRYMACHGLFNQMYAHLAAYILAKHLDADVMMPPSLFRSIVQTV